MRKRERGNVRSLLSIPKRFTSPKKEELVNEVLKKVMGAKKPRGESANNLS